MIIKNITEDFAVAEQLTAADVDALAAQGVKSLMCNRPDGEAAEQPAFAEVEAAALRHGLQIRHVPVVSGAISDSDIAAFGAAFAQLPRPLVAYCRSGSRSANLWAMDQAAQGAAPDAILSAGRAAGFDLADSVKRTAPKNGLHRRHEALRGAHHWRWCVPASAPPPACSSASRA